MLLMCYMNKAWRCIIGDHLQASLRAAAEERQQQWRQVVGECERQIASLEARRLPEASLPLAPRITAARIAETWSAGMACLCSVVRDIGKSKLSLSGGAQPQEVHGRAMAAATAEKTAYQLRAEQAEAASRAAKQNMEVRQ